MGTSSSQNAETLISQRLEAVDKLRVDLLQKGTITFEQSALLATWFCPNLCCEQATGDYRLGLR